jgi:hypothetical protein
MSTLAFCLDATGQPRASVIPSARVASLDAIGIVSGPQVGVARTSLGKPFVDKPTDLVINVLIVLIGGDLRHTTRTGLTAFLRCQRAGLDALPGGLESAAAGDEHASRGIPCTLEAIWLVLAGIIHESDYQGVA